MCPITDNNWEVILTALLYKNVFFHGTIAPSKAIPLQALTGPEGS
jgi:hypothetical protein